MQTKYALGLCNLLLFFLLSTHTQIYAQSNLYEGKKILGNSETIILTDDNIKLNAKLDTGATMTSLSASNIHIFYKNNQQWVEFTIVLTDQRTKYKLIKPLVRHVKILKRSEESLNGKVYIKRPVVNLSICIGDKKLMLDVNLADRSNFKYPMLLGIDAIKKLHAVVDVNQQHLLNPSCPESLR